MRCLICGEPSIADDTQLCGDPQCFDEWHRQAHPEDHCPESEDEDR